MNTLILATLILSFSEQPASSKADPKAQAKPAGKDALKLTQELADKYEFYREDDPKRRLTLRTKPILRWSNPVAGRIYGNVFIWMAKGRPEVVSSVFKWYSPYTHMAAECHSLSLGKLTAKRDGRQVWAPSRPGIELKPIPDAAAPSNSRGKRLRQMRGMARQFSAHKTDREKVSRTLRLLPQPVYRYESRDPELLDGAMFAFVQGTDPEVFLLIEARGTDGDQQWQYGLARMNSVHLRVLHNEREVWRVDLLPWSQVSNRREPYTSFMHK